ncbi:metallophosphoesterase [Candidatus Woesearchaeota archaeon]|nr:metallophosphoesterase [Candidatus Woesearchaeota archaeon]
MKILATGDIHGDIGLARKLADKAKEQNVDLVLICGDFTYFEQSTSNIIGPFAATKKPVALIPGNHETLATAEFLAQLYGATNLHGYSMRFGDVGIFGCGGANIGLFQLTEKEIYDELAKAHDKVKDAKIKVMVTHVHPVGSTMERFTKHFPGSEGVKKALDRFKPQLHLCSHVHEAEGVEEKMGQTTVINVGKSGKIIEL